MRCEFRYNKQERLNSSYIYKRRSQQTSVPGSSGKSIYKDTKRIDIDSTIGILIKFPGLNKSTLQEPGFRICN